MYANVTDSKYGRIGKAVFARVPGCNSRQINRLADQSSVLFSPLVFLEADYLLATIAGIAEENV